MRVLADPATGELVEVLDKDHVVGTEPYDYREGKAAHMRQSLEHRDAVALHDTRVRAKAAAEKEYRKQLALAILEMKNKHGSTIAEQLAKGKEPVLEAREKLTIAEGLVKSALEYIEVCKGDRVGISQLVKASLGDQQWGAS